MNTTLEDGRALATALAAEAAADQAVDVLVCPPYPYLVPVKEALGSSSIQLGAQDCYFEDPGAFTGEVATQMLTDVGCSSVILGHSERRHVIGETDELINKKVHKVLSAGLIPVLCVGELLSDREADQTETVLDTQLSGGLADVTEEQMAQIVIAYEPVWAIGTGVTASPEQAEAAHAYIRGWLESHYSSTVAEQTRILYGGSVKPGNAEELMSQANVDGALVGGASLKADSFQGIISAGANVSE